MKKIIKLISAALFVAVLGAAVFGGAVIGRRYIPSKEAADIGELFAVEGNKVSIVWNEEIQEEQALYEEGQVYLPLDWINENLNERF